MSNWLKKQKTGITTQDKKEVPEVVSMDPVRVTAETLGQWSRQLRQWGFPDVPEEYLKLK